MSHKASTNPGYFMVTSYCRKNTTTVPDVARGSSNVEHVIEIENGSTLPYDLTVDSLLPDAPPHKPGGTTEIEFAHHGGAHRTDWTGDVPQLAAADTQKDFALMHCIATHTGSARIHSPKIEYRLDASVAWQSDPTAPLLAIDITIN